MAVFEEVWEAASCDIVFGCLSHSCCLRETLEIATCSSSDVLQLLKKQNKKKQVICLICTTLSFMKEKTFCFVDVGECKFFRIKSQLKDFLVFMPVCPWADRVSITFGKPEMFYRIMVIYVHVNLY